MEEETIVTPAEEVKKTEEATVEANDTVVEETIAEVLQEKEEVKKDKNVPLSTFLEVKKDNKRLEKEMQDLKQSIESGISKQELSKDLKDIAERHNVDENFLEEFASAVRSKAKQEIEDEVSSVLKPFKEKERAEKLDSVFNQHYDKVIETMPELKNIVNKGVIKSLSLLPENAKKTFSQLIEESYGHLVTGKRTIETSTTRGGKNDNQDIDFSRTKDPEYYKQIMADPALKKKYNEGLVERLKL